MRKRLCRAFIGLPVPDLPVVTSIAIAAAGGECLPGTRKWPPKGSYPHPDRGYVLPGKSKNGIHIISHLKAEPDTEKLAKAFIELAKHNRRTRN